jgi:hypothetical protein
MLATALFSTMPSDAKLAAISASLIPVLVTGIQPRRVCAVKDSFPVDKESPAPKDLGALDSCDKHRNEGENAAVMVPHRRCRIGFD